MPTATVQAMAVGRSSLAYRHVSSSEPAATPIVITGGAFANVFSFQLIERALSNLGPVYVVDLPGAGMAGPPSPDDSRATLVDALRAFVCHLPTDRVHLVGICAGGPIVHAIAATDPHRVASLVLGSTVLEPTTEQTENLLRVCEALDAADAPQMAESVITMLMGSEQHPGVTNGPAARKLLMRTLQETSPLAMQRMSQALGNGLKPWPDRPDRVDGVRCLAYTGEFDPFSTQRLCAEAASTVANALFLSFRNADHMVHVERPRELAHLLFQFIARSALDPLPDFVCRPGPTL